MPNRVKVELITLLLSIIIFSLALTYCFIKLEKIYDNNKQSIITDLYNNTNNFYKLTKEDKLQ